MYFMWFRSNADEKSQIWSCEQIGTVKNTRSSGHSFGCIEVVLSQCFVCLRTENCALCFLQQLNGHKISRQPRNNLDILISVTLYKLVWPLSRAVFWSCHQLHFQMQPRYKVCIKALFRCTVKQWNWKCARNPISDAKARSRARTYFVLISNNKVSVYVICDPMTYHWK